MLQYGHSATAMMWDRSEGGGAIKLSAGIRKHGFSKWYERELLQSHGHLLLTFLCMVGLFAAFEALGSTLSWVDQALDILAIGLCAAIGLWALRRYLYLLNHAEATASQADCPQCNVHGRFAVESEDDKAQTLKVRCRKCSQVWTIMD
jgi:predicted Zn finger-like uncharacterized protein